MVADVPRAGGPLPRYPRSNYEQLVLNDDVLNDDVMEAVSAEQSRRVFVSRTECWYYRSA